MHRRKPGIPEEPVKLKIKKGDSVEVIAGKDRGKRGVVQRVLPKLNKVVVVGDDNKPINRLIRHRKERPTRKASSGQINEIVPGGQIEEAAPLFAAKVMLVCPQCKRPTRVGYAFREGSEKLSRRKYRVCKHPDCGKAIDA